MLKAETAIPVETSGQRFPPDMQACRLQLLLVNFDFGAGQEAQSTSDVGSVLVCQAHPEKYEWTVFGGTCGGKGEVIAEERSLSEC